MRKRPAFLACYDAGRRFHSKSFILFVAPRPGEADPWRLGVAAGKKIGNAVRRNRVKRLIRECVRRHQHLIDIPVDMVVVVKRHVDPGAMDLKAAERELVPLVRTAQSALRSAS